MSRNDERAVAREAGADVDLGRSAGERPGTSPRASARGGPAGRSRSAMNASSGSYLACCLPPNAPPGSGAWMRTLASGRPSSSAMTRWSQFGCWIDAPDRDAVAVRRGHERVRLDGELGDHREVVGALDDEIGVRAAASTSPQPWRCSRRTLVSASGSPGRSDGSCTSGASGGERTGDREDGRAAPRTRPRRARRLPRPRPASPRRRPRPGRRGTSSRRWRSPAGRGTAGRSAASAAAGPRRS